MNSVRTFIPSLGWRALRASLAAAVILAAPLSNASAAMTTLIGTVPQRGQMAQHSGLVVVSQLREDGKATLAIGGQYGAPRAIHTHTLPPWGQPHVGTSEIGTTVIVYPHCWHTKELKTCNLFAFDVTTGTDAELRGEAARRGTAEIEGDMDRGALVIARWTAARAPDVLSLGGHAEGTTRLLYQPFGKPAKALGHPGGQQLDLDRGRIAQIRNRTPGTTGSCGDPAVEIVDTRGGARTITHEPCGAAGQTLFAPTLIGHDVVWGLRTKPESLLLRAPAKGGPTVRAATAPFAVIAPSGPSSAFQLRGDVNPALGSDPTRLTLAWTFALSDQLPLS